MVSEKLLILKYKPKTFKILAKKFKTNHHLLVKSGFNYLNVADLIKTA